MAFKLNKARARKSKASGVKRDDSIDRITVNFGLSPERPRVRFIKKRNGSNNEAGQSETSSAVQ